MAKIRVAQIKDLSLTVPTIDNGFATLKVGTTTKDVLTSLAEGTAVNVTEATNGIMTGIRVSGNTITPEYKTFEQLSIYSKTEVDAAITTAINGLDATVANINALTNGTTTDDIRVEVVETDGKITAVNVTDTLKSIAHSGLASDVTVTPNGNLTSTNVQDALAELQGDIDTINGQTISEAENQAVRVSTENGNTTIGLLLNEETGKAILSQTADGLKTTLTVDTKKYPTESTAEGYVAEKAGKTYIQIKGVGGNVVSETDAAAFVKDGFLQSVQLIEATEEGQENVLRFTWNSDAGSQVTEINVSDLCDVYTAKANDWIQLNGFEFSHKLSTVIPTAGEGEEQATSKTVGSATATVVDAAGETVTFNVPSITVDRAGHVTSASETEVTVILPNFVLTVVGEQTELNNSEYVNVKAVKDDDSTELTLTSTVKTQDVATATDEQDGLATALDVKTYVDNAVSTASHFHVTQEFVVSETVTSPFSLEAAPYTDFEFVVYQNGIALNKNEYTVRDSTVTLNMIPDVSVALEAGDVIKVSYFTTDPPTNA